MYFPITRPVRTTAPTFEQEPISREEARHQCGISSDASYYDPLLDSLIITAREMVERDTGLVAYTGSFTSKMTDWGYYDYFELPDIRPITAVSSITYVDTAGSAQTWSSSNYVVSTTALMQYVRLAYGQVWPTLRGDGEGITITFVAGYASRLVMPARLKHAVKLLVNHWFVSRDTIGTIGPELSLTYDSLIESLTRYSYA